MFGIEKGVATGVEARIGKIEHAQGGTLFLDEIGEMPLHLQVKMLRVLEERCIERVGGRTAIPVDLRIIAATNRDLKTEMVKGNFREDLFYRLNGIELRIPPLRERKDDISLISRYFLEQRSRNCGRAPLRFSGEVVELLRRYPWPGNVRELENEVERAVALACTDTITSDDLSEAVQRCQAGEQASRSTPENSEKMLVERALSESGGNKTKAAQLLCISREGLRKKLKRLEIS